jgi:hypothetical protein
MVATRSRDRGQTDLQASEGAKGQDAVKQRHQQAVIPSAVEQEQQLQADRALIKEYRKQWQSNKGVSHAVFRWVVELSRLTCLNMPGQDTATVSCSVHWVAVTDCWCNSQDASDTDDTCSLQACM